MLKKKVSRKRKSVASTLSRVERLSKIYNALVNVRHDVLKKYGVHSPQWYKADRKAVRANTLLMEAAAEYGYEKHLSLKKPAHRKNPSSSALPKNPHHPAYSERVKLPKYNGPTTALHAHGSDGGKILRRMFPNATKAEHLAVAKKYLKRYNDYHKLWMKIVRKAALDTFGRPWEFGDYKVSGIGSDKFPEKVKDRLRKLVRDEETYKRASHAHQYAAGLRKLKYF